MARGRATARACGPGAATSSAAESGRSANRAAADCRRWWWEGPSLGQALAHSFDLATLDGPALLVEDALRRVAVPDILPPVADAVADLQLPVALGAVVV